MKCCDSSTSAIAASTSALMDRYCSLRSSRGTFILGFLFELLVGLRADTQCRGQRRFLIEIETPQSTRLRLDVPVTALGASHDPVGIGVLQAMSMAAHPAHLTSRVSDDQREVRHVFGHYGTRSDEGISANGRAADDCRICADGAAPLQNRGFVESMPVDLGTRIRDICEHAGRPEEDIVFNRYTCVDRHVVLNLDVVPDDRAAVDVDVLADDALLTNSRALQIG